MDIDDSVAKASIRSSVGYRSKYTCAPDGARRLSDYSVSGFGSPDPSALVVARSRTKQAGEAAGVDRYRAQWKTGY